MPSYNSASVGSPLSVAAVAVLVGGSGVSLFLSLFLFSNFPANTTAALCGRMPPHWLICFLSLLAYYGCSVEAGINERHLINRLLANYNPLERPVANESEKLKVTFGLTLQQIIDVVCKGSGKLSKLSPNNKPVCFLFAFIFFQDEKNQVLVSNLWLKFVSSKHTHLPQNRNQILPVAMGGQLS